MDQISSCPCIDSKSNYLFPARHLVLAEAGGKVRVLIGSLRYRTPNGS